MRSTSTTLFLAFQTTETTFALARISTHGQVKSPQVRQNLKAFSSKWLRKILTIGRCHCVCQIHVSLWNQSHRCDLCRVLCLPVPPFLLHGLAWAYRQPVCRIDYTSGPDQSSGSSDLKQVLTIHTDKHNLTTVNLNKGHLTALRLTFQSH